jgi:hypothetical protein
VEATLGGFKGGGSEDSLFSRRAARPHRDVGRGRSREELAGRSVSSSGAGGRVGTRSLRQHASLGQLWLRPAGRRASACAVRVAGCPLQHTLTTSASERRPKEHTMMVAVARTAGGWYGGLLVGRTANGTRLTGRTANGTDGWYGGRPMGRTANGTDGWYGGRPMGRTANGARRLVRRAASGTANGAHGWYGGRLVGRAGGWYGGLLVRRVASGTDGWPR